MIEEATEQESDCCSSNDCGGGGIGVMSMSLRTVKASFIEMLP